MPTEESSSSSQLNQKNSIKGRVNLSMNDIAVDKSSVWSYDDTSKPLKSIIMGLGNKLATTDIYCKKPPVVESHDDLGYSWSDMEKGWVKNLYNPLDDTETKILIRDGSPYSLAIIWDTGRREKLMEFSSFEMANAFAMSKIKERLREE